MTDVPKLGKLIEDGDCRRDAIHVAIAPVTASEALFPGQHIGFTSDANFEQVSGGAKELIGIVDPYLTDAVKPKQRFWMCLYPDTVTSLRHAWTHKAFDASKLRWVVPGPVPYPYQPSYDSNCTECKGAGVLPANFSIAGQAPLIVCLSCNGTGKKRESASAK